MHPRKGVRMSLAIVSSRALAGIVPIGSFDGRPVAHPGHPLIARIQEGYRERTRSSEYRTELYIGAT